MISMGTKKDQVEQKRVECDMVESCHNFLFTFSFIKVHRDKAKYVK
jgi:hypothetical protein